MIVLIDDDYMIRKYWTIMAKSKGIAFIAFESYEQFQGSNLKPSDVVEIYIDSNLGSDLRGEELSKNIFESGYLQIYLTTGFQDIEIQNYAWLKGVVSKRPPF